MPKERLTISVDRDIIEAGAAAVAEGRADSMSAWVSGALADRVAHERRLAAMADAVAAYEAEFGVITDEEIAEQGRRDRDASAALPRQGHQATPWCGVTLVLDAGAFVAIERGDREMWTRFKAEGRAGGAPITHGGVIAQVWRGGGGRQALLARALVGVHVVPLDEDLGRRAGVLLARTRTTDAIDAAVAVLATDDDQIATSDPDDLLRLVAATGRHVDVVPT